MQSVMSLASTRAKLQCEDVDSGKDQAAFERCSPCAGQLALGSKLAAGGPLPLNPFVTAGWAALLANALNCIPIGRSLTHVSVHGTCKSPSSLLCTQ